MERTKVPVKFKYDNKLIETEGVRYVWPKIPPLKGVEWMNWFCIELNPEKRGMIILIAENKEGKLVPYCDGHPTKEHIANIIIRAMKK